MWVAFACRTHDRELDGCMHAWEGRGGGLMWFGRSIDGCLYEVIGGVWLGVSFRWHSRKTEPVDDCSYALLFGRVSLERRAPCNVLFCTPACPIHYPCNGVCDFQPLLG